METFYSKSISILFGMLLLYSVSANAEQLKPDRLTQPTQLTRFTQPTKLLNDPTTQTITKDRLNDFRDENGNRIFHEDPEGDAMQRKIFNGLVPGSSFAHSAGSAGDVNGDGYEDIIMGAHNYSSSTGRAYIYYGGANMNFTPDVVLTGEATNNFFGYSVSSAGDVNGDGYDDVVVGAYGYSTNTGRAYVYYGSSLMNNGADVTMTGGVLNLNFGVSVSSAGDADGDGFSDVMVGAPGYSTNTGRAFLFLGSPSMNNVSDLTLTGAAVNNDFGISVSSAGDVNGDGFSDFIAGASGFSTNTGRAYIFFGGNVLNIVADITLTGAAVNNYFGGSVSSAGDVNGDGFSDVVAGASGYSTNTGRSYVYLGGSAMDIVVDLTLTGEASNNFFGASVSSAGDVNGDGYSDVIAGAYGYSSNTGRAYIFFGGASLNNTADVTLTGEAPAGQFAVSVSGGDINGDGYTDLIIGADAYNAGTGRAYLFDYFMKGEITADLTMTGGATGDNLGISVSSAGDVNGDGYSDVIVGANGYNTTTGRAYIFFGGPLMDNVADVTMTGETTVNYFGYSVSSAGDVNGDGYSDVIVGAWRYSASAGRAYIFFGGSSMNNTADVTMSGAAGINFGYSVSDAGDVDGDGYSDVIVGAQQYNAGTGRAYIFLGGPSMNNVPDVTMTGEAAGDNFSYSVSSADDVNGDGYSDVIVGAYGHNSSIGRAYIFFGGISVDNVADVIMTGEATNIYFGLSVSTAGDVNGDGYSDVIVSSDFSTNIGKVYIFFGSASMDNAADVTMTGEGADSFFGFSVSSAGDINLDGYSDVIVGACGNTVNTGRSYVFLGGASMDTVSDIKMTAEATGSLFGQSVSSAGDVNGDGYPDFLAGSPRFSSVTGRAYIYKGSAISAKPILIHVKDVPDDQGGNVMLKWARSSFDVTGNNVITNYAVYRSYPPSGGNFSWEEIFSMNPSHHAFYTYTAPTPYDSGSNSGGNLFYKIRARTLNINEYWESAILSGRSIDNIAPLMVSPFTATSVSNDVLLNWGKSSAPDLLNYVLYRSTSPTIDPDTEPVFASTIGLTYLDTSPLSGAYYYFIVAQDIHNNKSPVAVTEAPNITLNATMFIEGFYNAAANNQVSDTITVYLRNQTSPFAIVDNAKSVAAANGSVVLKFGNAPTGNYFIVIRHRNSIETWSANGVSMTRGGSVIYNFSNAASKAFGDNMKQVDTSPVRFAIYSGDVNQDGVVDGTDAALADNDAFNFVTGYMVTDVNGDEIIDGSDAAIVDNNAYNFVGKITP